MNRLQNAPNVTQCLDIWLGNIIAVCVDKYSATVSWVKISKNCLWFDVNFDYLSLFKQQIVGA